jgi:fructosamine-3-kinase
LGNTKLYDSISNILEEEILQVSVLTGGDINTVSKITTRKNCYVVKTNRHDAALAMFLAEKEGLNALAASNSFKIPEVVYAGKENENVFLIMEYIASIAKNKRHDDEFGRLLAKLHKTTSAQFGFETHNYIGSLPQYNTKKLTAADFYIEMRLLPQFKMAFENGFTFQKGRLFKNITTLIPEEAPALVHGDLWSGNAITDADGLPCLIDPAVFYGHRETDIAMMKLFGGFPNRIFESYNTFYPLANGWRRRVDLWQLYYLLVHLNLFGGSYYGSVQSIVEKYN